MPSTQDLVDFFRVFSFVVAIYWTGRAKQGNICQDITEPLDIERLNPEIRLLRLRPSEDNDSKKIESMSGPIYSDYNSDDLKHLLNYFDPRLPTKVMIHGFYNTWPTKDNEENWIDKLLIALTVKPVYTDDKEVADAIDRDPDFGYEEFKGSVDYNIFVYSYDHIDFISDNGMVMAYNVLRASTKLIGNHFGAFLVRLAEISQIPIDLTGFHVIGHSIGAHVAGFAGKTVRRLTSDKLQIGFISALDPAGPCFEDLDASERLDMSDAHRVDVIHSNMGGFGTEKKFAHNNIVLNNGIHQPGAKNAMESHCECILRLLYNLDTSCQMMAFQCDDYEQYIRGDCPACSEWNSLGDGQNNCLLFRHHPMFGQPKTSLTDSARYHWAKLPDKSVTYFTTTVPTEPHCLHVAQLNLYSLSDIGEDFEALVISFNYKLTIKIYRSQRQPKIIDSANSEEYYHYTGLIETNISDRVISVKMQVPNPPTGIVTLLHHSEIHIEYRSNALTSSRKALSSKLCLFDISGNHLHFQECSPGDLKAMF